MDMLLTDMSDKKRKVVEKALASIKVSKIDVIRGAKNPMAVSYESNEMTVITGFELESKVDPGDSDLVVVLTAYLSTKSTYLAWMTSGLINSKQFREAYDALVARTRKLVDMILD